MPFYPSPFAHLAQPPAEGRLRKGSILGPSALQTWPWQRQLSALVAACNHAPCRGSRAFLEAESDQCVSLSPPPPPFWLSASALLTGCELSHESKAPEQKAVLLPQWFWDQYLIFSKIQHTGPCPPRWHVLSFFFLKSSHIIQIYKAALEQRSSSHRYESRAQREECAVGSEGDEWKSLPCYSLTGQHVFACAETLVREGLK